MIAAVLVLVLAAAPPPSGGAAAAYFERAARALSGGDYETAEEGFLAVLKLEPNSVPALGNLGVTYSRMERFADAVRVYRRALKLAPNEPGLILNLGLAHLKQEDYAAAKPLFARLPRSEQSSQLLATCELFTGQAGRALALLEGLPRSAEVMFLTGTAQLRLGRKAEAKESFRELLAASSPAQAHLLMGRAYSENAQFDEAIGELKQALDLDRGSLAARMELAKAQIGLRQNEEAEANLREVLRTNPRHPDGAYYLGSLLVLLSREDEAFPLLELSRTARPDAWGAYYYLGRAWMQKGQAGKALPLLEQAVKLNPGEMSAWYQLTRAAKAMGLEARSKEALARYEALRKANMAPDSNKPVPKL